jgi:hypothetical protein
MGMCFTAKRKEQSRGSGQDLLGSAHPGFALAAEHFQVRAIANRTLYKNTDMYCAYTLQNAQDMEGSAGHKLDSKRPTISVCIDPVKHDCQVIQIDTYTCELRPARHEPTSRFPAPSPRYPSEYTLGISPDAVLARFIEEDQAEGEGERQEDMLDRYALEISLKSLRSCDMRK